MYEGVDELYREITSLVRTHRLKDSRDNDAIKSYFLKQKKRGLFKDSYNMYLGILCGLEHNHKQAIRYFKKIRFYNESPVINNNIGAAYYQLGKIKKAVKYLDRALAYEEQPFPLRHWMLAQANIKLGKHSIALSHLKRMVELTSDEYVKKIYIKAYKAFDLNQRIPIEFLDALENNSLIWDLDILESIPVLLTNLEQVYLALTNLMSERHKKLSIQSQNTRILAHAYIHHLRAAIALLGKNYTLASYSVGRSMFESYIKIFHGLLTKNNKNYAQQEHLAIRKKINANERYIAKQLLGDKLSMSKAAENKKLTKKIRSLEKRYKGLKNDMESFSQLAILSDDLRSTNIFSIYQAVYEKGSDSIHLNHDHVKRMYELSGDNSLSIALDSQSLIRNIIRLSISLGDLYVEIPELSKIGRSRYKRFAKTLRKI